MAHFPVLLSIAGHNVLSGTHSPSYLNTDFFRKSNQGTFEADEACLGHGSMLGQGDKKGRLRSGYRQSDCSQESYAGRLRARSMEDAEKFSFLARPPAPQPPRTAPPYTKPLPERLPNCLSTGRSTLNSRALREFFGRHSEGTRDAVAGIQPCVPRTCASWPNGGKL